MKKTIAIVGLGLLTVTLSVGIAEAARRPRYVCYAPDPTTPWVEVCTTQVSHI